MPSNASYEYMMSENSNPTVAQAANENPENWDRVAEEIASEMMLLCSGSEKEEVMSEVSNMRQRIGGLSLVSELFRKYKVIATSINRKAATEPYLNIIYDKATQWMPIESQNMDEISGTTAAQTWPFVLRCAIALFALISFVVMATVYHVNFSYYNPAHGFHNTCRHLFGILDGSFNMRPFQFVLAVGVILCVCMCGSCGYYLLPHDSDGNKMIPGVPKYPTLEGYCQRFLSVIRRDSKLWACYMDGFLLFLCLISCLIASITIERSASFHCSGSYCGERTKTYFTLGSFFMTALHQNPICVGEDPTPKIRASLAMMYFCLFLCFLSLQTSIKSYRHLSGPVGTIPTQSSSEKLLWSSPQGKFQVISPNDRDGDDITL